MYTKLEDLSTELWFEIFTYLKTRDQLKTFFNLKKGLNQIVLCYQTRVSCKNNDEETQYLFDHILPHLTHRENIGSLRLENTKKIDLLKYADLLHFPKLHSLILHRLSVDADLLHILQKNVLHLRYLYLSVLVSVDRKCKQELLEMIFSLENLQKCQLCLRVSMFPEQSKISQKSSIKSLRLVGMDEICYGHRLVILLNYLPHLQSLYIKVNQLNLSSPIETKHFLSRAPVSMLTLNIHAIVVSLVQLTNFIWILTPHVQELTIICRSAIHSLIYLDDQDWIRLVQLLSNLQTLTLNIYHVEDIDEKLWEKKCKKLTKAMTINGITLQIRKSIK